MPRCRIRLEFTIEITMENPKSRISEVFLGGQKQTNERYFPKQNNSNCNFLVHLASSRVRNFTIAMYLMRISVHQVRISDLNKTLLFFRFCRAIPVLRKTDLIFISLPKLLYRSEIKKNLNNLFPES